jgi:geranylgeranyl reductase family protein
MKVSIVGGGPAGSITAASAAEEGHHVHVYEEHEKIGQPEHCGGLLSPKAIKWFSDLGVRCKRSIANETERMRIEHGGTHLDLRIPALVIKRGMFDRACADFAISKGARITTGRRFSRKDVAGLAKSSFIIGADGPHSVVAKSFGFPPLRYAVAYQADVRDGRFEKEVVDVFPEKLSFGWVIPMNEEVARVGMVFFEGADCQKFKLFLQKILERTKGHVSYLFADCIPVEVRSEIQRNGVYLVGDAAGQVKATSGGGIYYGARSGWLAGKCIETFDYERKWREEIGRQLSRHGTARKLVNAVPPSFLVGTARLLNFFYPLEKYNMEEVSSLFR